jgi:hypothetical protein
MQERRLPPDRGEVMNHLQLANRLVNLSRHTREGRVVDAFTRNARVRKKMIAAMRAKGYGEGLADDAPEWLMILLEVVKALLPILLTLI